MAAVLNSFNLDAKVEQSPIFGNAISMYFPRHLRQEFDTKDCVDKSYKAKILSEYRRQQQNQAIFQLPTAIRKDMRTSNVTEPLTVFLSIRGKNTVQLEVYSAPVSSPTSHFHRAGQCHPSPLCLPQHGPGAAEGREGETSHPAKDCQYLLCN